MIVGGRVSLLGKTCRHPLVEWLGLVVEDDFPFGESMLRVKWNMVVSPLVGCKGNRSP